MIDFREDIAQWRTAFDAIEPPAHARDCWREALRTNGPVTGDPATQIPLGRYRRRRVLATLAAAACVTLATTTVMSLTRSTPPSEIAARPPAPASRVDQALSFARSAINLEPPAGLHLTLSLPELGLRDGWETFRELIVEPGPIDLGAMGVGL